MLPPHEREEGKKKVSVSAPFMLLGRSDGFASGELGSWRQRDGETSEPVVNVESDGYGTGFVVFVLRQAGVKASDPRIRKGVAWLVTHQRANGHWWTQALRNEPDTSNYLTHAGTTFAVLEVKQYQLGPNREQLR